MATFTANFAIRCHFLIKLGDVSQPDEGRAVTGDRVARSAPVTLNDVAREADVAVSTVSRALSNPERVSRATREHVQAVARRLGYQANRSAGGSQMLALLIHDVTNPYNFGLIRGAESQARAAGYTLILCHTQESPELETTHAERLLTTVDGLILAASRLPAEQLREIAARAPVVLFNRQLAGFASVVLDSVDGSRQIVEHLHALGHRSIAYLAGPRNAWTNDERWRSLSSTAAALEVEIVRLGPFLPTLEQGAAAADVGLSSGATALVAFNDLLAIGALQRLERRGIAVPEAISVVGFDDIFGSDFCHPPLTTVSGPVEEAGRSLVDLLVSAVQTGQGRSGSTSPASRQQVVPTHLRIRDSTGTAPGRP